MPTESATFTGTAPQHRGGQLQQLLERAGRRRRREGGGKEEGGKEGGKEEGGKEGGVMLGFKAQQSSGCGSNGGKQERTGKGRHRAAVEVKGGN